MRTKNVTRRIATVVALLVALVTVGVATAAWLQTGTGSGSAQATTAVASTIVASTPVADLYPGKTGGSVFFTVSNPNPYPVTFTSLAAGTVTSGDPTNCPASNVAGDHAGHGQHRRPGEQHLGRPERRR